MMAVGDPRRSARWTVRSGAHAQRSALAPVLRSAFRSTRLTNRFVVGDLVDWRGCGPVTSVIDYRERSRYLVTGITGAT
jgi:hypothetical protein